MGRWLLSALRITWLQLRVMLAAPLSLLALTMGPTLAVVAAQSLNSGPAAGIPIAVVDQDQTPYSRRVTAALMQKPGLRVAVVSEVEAVRRVQTQRVEAACLLPAGFMRAIQTGEDGGRIRVLHGPASRMHGMVAEYALAEVIRLSGNGKAADWVVREYRRLGIPTPGGEQALWQAVWAHADRWGGGGLVGVESAGQAIVAHPPLPSTPHPTPQAAAAFSRPIPRTLTLGGLVASLLLLNGLVAAGVVVADGESGIRTRLWAAGLTPAAYLVGSALTLIAVIATAAALAGAAAAAGLGLAAGEGAPSPTVLPASLLALWAAYLGAVCGLSLLAGGLLRSRRRLQAAAPLLALGTALLGGGVVNLAEVSRRFDHLALLTPQGWLLRGMRAALVAGGDGSGVGMALGGLVALALLGFVLGYCRIARETAP